MQLMYPLLCILYIAYVIAVFNFLSKLFGAPMIKKRHLFLVLIINSYIVYVPIFLTLFQYGWLLWISYFCILGLEIVLLFKKNRLLSFAMILGFVLNFFATLTLFIGLHSLRLNIQVVDMLANQQHRIIITTLTFLLLVPYNFIGSKLISSKIVSYIDSNKTSLKMASILLGSVCLIQLISIPTLYVQTDTIRFNAIYQIRTGLLALFSFIVIMVLVYIYARLKEASETYVDTTAEIASENVTITKIETEAKTDFFTGFYVKSIAENKLQSYVHKKKFCYIVYLDMDGLKIVNDTFGHEEGDWYIKTVSKCIRDAFKGDTIARIGGDEFLVVGNITTGAPITKKVKDCYENVLKLKGQNKKPYETSLSYGIVEVATSNELSVNDLIDLADEKMYIFKKARHKERTSRK